VNNPDISSLFSVSSEHTSARAIEQVSEDADEHQDDDDDGAGEQAGSRGGDPAEQAVIAV